MYITNMKLLMTISYFTPYISGLTIHAERLASSFSKRGFQVKVLTTEYDKSLPLIDNIDNVRIIRVPYSFRFSKGFIMLAYPYYAWKALRQTDTVIINLPQFEGAAVALLAKIMRKKIICIYHCEVILPKGIINGFIQALMHISHYICLSSADYIVTYTEDYAAHTFLLPFFRRKVKAIYPPVPVPAADKKITDKIRNLIPQKTKYIIGVAARFAAEKGIEYLMGAIPDIEKEIGSSFVIMFAGPRHPVGEGAYWEKMKPEIGKYKNKFIFTGTIPEKYMGSFYSLLDVLVLPSINSTEAFGMVQVEAMLCGVPVVASNLPGVRIPIRVTGMGKIAQIKNSHDLADKICLIIKNPDLYKKPINEIANIFSLQAARDSIGQLL